MFQTVVMGVAAVVIGILVWAALRPDTFRIERRIVVDAPPEAVFALLADMTRGSEWSPFERDPAMVKTLSGPSSGVGAKAAWVGNRQVGEGSMEITEATPAKIVMDLIFLKPFKAHNTAEFLMSPTGSGTTLTWAMYGPQPYPARLMTLFISMDRMVGKDFETGLANVKRVVEG